MLALALLVGLLTLATRAGPTHGDTDAGADEHFNTAKLHRRTERLGDPLSDLFRLGFAYDVFQ